MAGSETPREILIEKQQGQVTIAMLPKNVGYFILNTESVQKPSGKHGTRVFIDGFPAINLHL